MKYIVGISIALQLASTMTPAISVETQVPTASPQPVRQKPKPCSANVPERSQGNSTQQKLTQSDDKTQLSERDRLILERYLIKIIPKASD
jgi:hypothetical protein